MTDINMLNKFVKEGVKATVEKKSAEDLIDSIAGSMEDKLDIKKAEAKKIIAHAYEKAYNTDKFNEKKTKIEELYETLDVVEV